MGEFDGSEGNERELVSQGEIGYVPFRVLDSSGKLLPACEGPAACGAVPDAGRGYGRRRMSCNRRNRHLGRSAASMPCP